MTLINGKTISEKIKSDNELFNRFLKFQGTIYKHNAYVALEFFAQKPDVDFIGTAAQWEQVGYTVGLGERGIKITDKSGKTFEYFDFSQTLEEKKPMVWTLTKNNVLYLKKELKLPDDKPMIYSLVNRTVKIDDIKQCMKAMGIPNSKATEFINSYANAVQVIISGRLESGGNKFSVKADNTFMKSLSYEQTMYFLMHTLKSARTALDLVEESIKKFNEHERMKRNDIRTVDETENRRETEHTERRTADNTERATGEQADIIENDKNIRQSADVGNITAAAPESENSSVAGIHERDVSGRQNVELPSESYDRNIQSDNRESGTVNGRGTDRIVRNEMDGFHGEGISSSVQYNDAGTQISDRSTQSGQGSTGIQGDSGQSVHGSESETKRIRGNSEVGTGTNDIYRQHSNERDSVSTEEITDFSFSDKLNKEASAESADASLYIKEILAVLNQTDNRYDNSVKLCNTPDIFVNAGLSQLPMLYSKKHLRDALKPKTDKNSHYHGLTVSQIEQIPKLLAEPAIIFDSISPINKNSIVAVLNAVDNDNAPLLVTITPNGKGTYQLEEISSNYITSIYGKDNAFENYINRVIASGNILFWDKNKSQELFSVLGLQLPQGLKVLDSNTIIHKSATIVNISNNINGDSESYYDEDDHADDDLPEIVYASNPSRRLSDNMDAIRRLKDIEYLENQGENVIINELDEQILRQYVGWGGLSQVFDDNSSIFNHRRQTLKSLLTEEEYKAAEASTLNAHFTPQFVIDAIYKAINNMDLPRNARILEPACGTGNFISRLPVKFNDAEVVGVELDSITARIADMLNRNNDKVTIINSPFEKSGLADNSFDIAIGNVPFGNYNLIDPDHKENWKIHDAFFRKALDKVAPGGVVAFITSTGTLDKKNPKVREYLSQKSDLIGAIRLPDNAFSDAGTKTATDIVFLQKRENARLPGDYPEWCYTAKNEDGLNINSYFVENPQMILGKMAQTSHFNMLTCSPVPGENLEDQLNKAITYLNAKITVKKREDAVAKRQGLIEPWGNNFTYQINENGVFYRENNVMHELKLKEKDKNQLSALIGLRSATRELVDLQRTSITDEELIPLRNKLNEMYDKYNAEYGAISSNKQTSKLFGMDYDYPLVLALEEYDKETNTYSKSDIFSKRTVNPYIDIKEAATLEDAFQISMDRKGKIDIPYMAELLKNVYTGENAPSRIADDLIEKGYAFRDPDEIVAGIPFADVREATEYLSGNVRRKLQSAEEHAKGNPEYTRNVDALKKVIPEDIPAEEIAAQMGCTWIDVEDYTKFLEHLSGRDVNHHRNCDVTYDALSGEYSVYKSSARTGFNVNESKTYGTEAMNVYKLAEKILNQRRIVVKTKVPSPYDPSKLVDVTDVKATALVLEKAKLIKSEFKKWLFDDEQRREKYVRRYNNIFNSLVGRKYDGSKLTFPGMNSEFKLRPHQRDCIARTIYGGNTLAAHVVGAGKSAVIVTSVMKKKEIGLINKACVVVPKALTEQTANEWRKIYPDARVLTVTQKDLQEDKRKIFTARVATGSYDAVIMSNEQFEKLAMSKEYQTRYIEKKVDEYKEALRNASGRTSVKKIQESLMKYKIKLENLQNPSSAMKEKDNLIEFESLGFDYLVVDEAHNYKNGDIISKMENVSGVSGKSSARAHDMQMKTDYFNEVFGQGHILFATGTPVSNSMTELYVMTRYLRPDLLKSHGVERFDDWAATFGTVVTKNQQTADGRLKMKTKFASFANLPELMAMYKEFADIQSAEKLNLPRPALKTGKIQIVQVKATPEQKAYVKLLAKRAEAVEAGKVKPYEDNHLAITGEARLVGLGNLAIKSLYERRGEELPADFVIEKNSKVDVCISKVAELYKQTEETKGVQIIFSDIAINSDNGNFSAYDYIRNELINEHGIPAEEIVYAPKSDAKNREQIFSDINNSKYRVVIASTATLGTGANIQKNLYALHHIDIPWKPSDFTQREGRILRQGNQNKEVEIFNYVTESTLDSYLYQTVTDKARFIAQLLDNNAPARVSEDCDEKVLSFAELQAAAEGNPEFKRRIELSNEISELTMLKSEYDYETAVTRRSLETYPGRIEMYKDNIAKCSIDFICASAVRENSLQITTHTGAVLTESKDINDYLIKVARNSAFSPNPSSIHFKIGDFDVRAKTALYIGYPNGAEFEVTGKLSYTCEAGTEDNSNNCARINNLFDKIIPKHMETLKAELECTEINMAQAKIRVETPFSDEEKLEKLTEEFNALEEKLSGLSDIKDDVIDAEEAAVTDSADANNNTNYDSPDSNKIDDDDGMGGPSI